MTATRSRRALTAAAALAAAPLGALPLAAVLATTGLIAAATPPAAAHIAAPASVSSDTRRAPRGIDVSSHQHPGGRAIDWPSVRAAGVSFAFVKADEGPGRRGRRYQNPWFQRDWKGARAAGLDVGAYHYARPRRPVAATADADARAFVATVAAAPGMGTMSPVLDLEEHGGLPAHELAAWVRQWLATVASLTGRRPIIYTGQWFWTERLGGTAEFGEHPLWMARYAGRPAPLPSAWHEWSFWQFTPSGRVPGVPTEVDINVSCGRPTVYVNECRASRFDPRATLVGDR